MIMWKWRVEGDVLGAQGGDGRLMEWGVEWFRIIVSDIDLGMREGEGRESVEGGEWPLPRVREVGMDF